MNWFHRKEIFDSYATTSANGNEFAFRQIKEIESETAFGSLTFDTVLLKGIHFDILKNEWFLISRNFDGK